jgi:hypothetical protein
LPPCDRFATREARRGFIRVSCWTVVRYMLLLSFTQ